MSKTPRFTADMLSFSGGTGSSALLWMVIKGVIPKPANFYVMNANPGMEDFRTYLYLDRMREECEKAGIDFVTIGRKNLFKDLTDPARRAKLKRIDNPPLWTVNPVTGKRGRLRQCCTKGYKIEPMNIVVRDLLTRDFGVSRLSRRLPDKCVVKWIGFTYDEWHRMSDGDGSKFRVFRYPLVEMKIEKGDAIAWMQSQGIDVPPRSVCLGCYANDVEYFRAMHDDRPADFEKACLFDDAIRDMRQFKVREVCFVSSTCIPLRDLAAGGFTAKDQPQVGECHSGYCFV